MTDPIRDQSFERSLPNSAEAERAILGAILLDNGLVYPTVAQLTPEMFYVPSHRRIYVAMIALSEAKSEINPILIGEELKKENALESVGGFTFITNLTYGLPHTTNITYYAKVIRGKALLRQLIKASNKITQDALEEEDDPETIFERAQEAIFALGIQVQLDARKPRTYEQIADNVFQLFGDWADGNIVAIPTQIPELDHRLAYGGLSAQDFIIIAARSSFGKTALALQIGLNVARSNRPVLICSLEMSGEKLFIRNLSSVTGVPHRQIKPWTFQHDRVTATKILQGIGRLKDQGIQVEDRIHDLNKLTAVAREWRRVNKADGLIIVDYLQLVKNSLHKRNRQEEVAGISTEMKRLAQELNVPVIGVSQFNRDPARQNRRPELSDLRESGQLEQDADVVLFPWSEDGLKDQEVRSMKLYCAKQRNGSVGWEIDIDFDGEKQWFYTEEMYKAERFA
jgi:replicative DNA helicase